MIPLERKAAIFYMEMLIDWDHIVNVHQLKLLLGILVASIVNLQFNRYSMNSEQKVIHLPFVS